jgi:hypothetical protein
MVIPTDAEEQSNPEGADAAYASAVMWLKERARGKDFPMVDRENAQYGFRRNLRGLKWIGIVSCLLTAVISLTVIAYQTPDLNNLVASRRWNELANQLGTFGPAVWSATAVNAIGILAWLTIVTYRWVWEGGLQYASALLATCDRIQQMAAVQAKSSRRR